MDCGYYSLSNPSFEHSFFFFFFSVICSVIGFWFHVGCCLSIVIWEPDRTSNLWVSQVVGFQLPTHIFPLSVSQVVLASLGFFFSFSSPVIKPHLLSTTTWDSTPPPDGDTDANDSHLFLLTLSHFRVSSPSSIKPLQLNWTPPPFNDRRRHTPLDEDIAVTAKRLWRPSSPLPRHLPLSFWFYHCRKDAAQRDRRYESWIIIYRLNNKLAGILFIFSLLFFFCFLDLNRWADRFFNHIHLRNAIPDMLVATA